MPIHLFNELLCPPHNGLKAGDLEWMQFISSKIFFAGELFEMRKTSAKCRRVYIYAHREWKIVVETFTKHYKIFVKQYYQ